MMQSQAGWTYISTLALRHLLAKCRDFKEEKTALWYLDSQHGVVVNLTPKFHAKLAGKGIE